MHWTYVTAALAVCLAYIMSIHDLRQSQIHAVAVEEGIVSATNHGLLTQTFFNKIDFSIGGTRTIVIKNSYGSNTAFAQVTLIMSGSTSFWDVQLIPARIGYYMGYYEISIKNMGADAAPAYFAVNIEIRQ